MGRCGKPISSLVAGISLSTFLCVHAPAKELLTPKEIERIQDAQQIDERVKVYLEAAALRLRTVEERMNGKESAEGDPLEFFTVEDMLDGYYRCLKSVMLNLDDAAQNPKTNPERMKKALTNLQVSTDKSATDLGVLKKMAEEKRLEQAWNLVRQALDITRGAREGAELGLSRYPDEKAKPRKP